jgi:pimeloyl-ACP methyl ester carboxylesterase
LVAYDEKGSGPPLVLVDGALMSRGGGRKPELVGLLSAHFTVVSYDRRGRGESGDTLPYEVRREVEDLNALVGQMGGRAFVFGHSSGACLALEASLALGERVPKVAVYDAPWNDDPAAQPRWSEYLTELGRALADGRRGDAVALFFAYIGIPPEDLEAMRYAPFWPGLEAVAPTLAYDHAGVMGPVAAVPRQRVSEVNAPVLVVHGELSQPFMRATAETLSEVIPAARLHRLEGQAHDVSGAALAPVLTEFFLS